MTPATVAPTAGGRRPTLHRVLVLALVLLGCWAGAAAPTPAPHDLDLGAVRPGMQGYAVTAGPGNALVRFPVEVLAVQEDAGPGYSLVLIRASGPFIEASGGIAAGMSGSPVYLGTSRGDGLLGAIAYVFTSAAHDLALVTPIAAMRAAVAEGSADPGPVAVAGYGEAVPVATPVLLAGLSDRATALVAPLFRDARVAPFPVQGGGVATEGAEQPRLEPGSAISVQLARGDVTVGAVGTVTAIDGDQVLALGHPLLGRGRVAFVLAGASVTAIVPSSVVPFKLANTGATVLGLIDQDRPAGIGGALGPGPAMVDVNLHVNAPNGTRSFAFQVVPDERLYPQLVAAATLELLDRTLASTTAGSAELAWEIALAGGDRLNLLDQADDAGDIALAAARAAGSPLRTLAVNAFREPGLRSVELTVRVTERRNAAAIAEVVAENSEVAAGEAIIAHVRLQPYREEAVVKTMSIEVPDDVEGTVAVTVRGGDVRLDDDDEPPGAGAEPRSFAELLDAMRGHPQASELVAEIPGADGKARRLARLSLDYVVTGSRTVEVTVAAPGGPAAPQDGETPEDAPEDAEEDAPPPPARDEPPLLPEGDDRAP